MFLQETRFKTHSGDSWEERQGRGKCSELSCLEVGVGWVRKILILTLRVSLVWSNDWSTLILSAWIYNPCASYRGTQQRPELMFGCGLTRICRFLAKQFWQERQVAGSEKTALKAGASLAILARSVHQRWRPTLRCWARVRRKASFLVISARLAKFMGSNKA